MGEFQKPCYIHNGPWEQCTVHEDVKHCFCVHRYDDYEMPKTPLFGVVPGGASKDSWRPKYEKDFSQGLDKYKAARKGGLRPEKPTKDGVFAAERDAESHERALESPVMEDADTSKLKVQGG